MKLSKFLSNSFHKIRLYELLVNLYLKTAGYIMKFIFLPKQMNSVATFECFNETNQI